MTRQTLYIGSYAAAILALFYFSAPGYALLVAGTLLAMAFTEPVLALALRCFTSPEPDDPATLENFHRRLSR